MKKHESILTFTVDDLYGIIRLKTQEGGVTCRHSITRART